MLKTFSIGGVHPHDNKLSAKQPIIVADVPTQAAMMVGQHIGEPAKPIVKIGDCGNEGGRIHEWGGLKWAPIT